MLSSYILFVASNIFFIFLLPLNVATNFLAIYPLISAILGVLTIYFGARGLLKDFALYSAIVVILITPMMLGFDLIGAISIFYVWAIYIADYLSSQSLRKIGIISYRFLNALCIIPLIISYESIEAFYTSIGLRTGIALFVIGFTVSKKLNPQPLKILSPIKYIVGTHVAYFLPLFFVPLMTSLEGIKIWYVFDQIVLGVYLKYFDYRIRLNETIKLFEKYRYLVALLISFALLAINIISFNIINTISIILSLFLLRFVGLRYFKCV